MVPVAYSFLKKQPFKNRDSQRKQTMVTKGEREEERNKLGEWD